MARTLLFTGVVGPALLFLFVSQGGRRVTPLALFMLATFLGLGKRAHELAWAERTGQAHETRASLAGYNIPVVRGAM